MRLLIIILGFTVGLLRTGTTRLAAQDNCQPLYDAMSKVMTTPTHIFTTTNTAPNSGGKPRTIETICVAGSTYVNFNGKWTRGPTPQQVVKQEEENRRNSKASCRYLHDESINGETVAVYSTHAETSDQKSDGQMWISKTRGLPLRQGLYMDTGNKSGKSRHSVATNTKTSSRRSCEELSNQCAEAHSTGGPQPRAELFSVGKLAQMDLQRCQAQQDHARSQPQAKSGQIQYDPPLHAVDDVVIFCIHNPTLLIVLDGEASGGLAPLHLVVTYP